MSSSVQSVILRSGQIQCQSPLAVCKIRGKPLGDIDIGMLLCFYICIRHKVWQFQNDTRLNPCDYGARLHTKPHMIHGLYARFWNLTRKWPYWLTKQQGFGVRQRSARRGYADQASPLACCTPTSPLCSWLAPMCSSFEKLYPPRPSSSWMPRSVSLWHHR